MPGRPVNEGRPVLRQHDVEPCRLVMDVHGVIDKRQVVHLVVCLQNIHILQFRPRPGQLTRVPAVQVPREQPARICLINGKRASRSWPRPHEPRPSG